MKWDRESFWHTHQKGDGECPSSLFLARELYSFSTAYYSKSKECLKVVKLLPDPCPEFTFQDDRISQKVLKKEKPVLKQETLFYYLQFSAVAQSCPTLCDPMKCSMPGLPVHHQLPDFTQHSNSCPSNWWYHPAISSSVVPFSSCPQSLPASESSHEMAKVLEFQL